MITAQDGLGGDPKDVQEMNDTVLWLMKSRAGLGAHGWQVLVGEGVVQVKELNANHFSMMHKPWVSRVPCESPIPMLCVVSTEWLTLT